MSILSSSKKREEDLTKKRDKKCEPLAQQIIQIIAKHNPSAAKFANFEDSLKVYGPVASEINKVLKDADVSISENNYIWSVVQSIMDQVKRPAVQAIQSSFELAEQKLFAVDNISDVTLSQINNVLLSK